jgi:hypothetical protein
MGAIDKFRAVFGDMDIRSVHHNVARLDAARTLTDDRVAILVLPDEADITDPIDSDSRGVTASTLTPYSAASGTNVLQVRPSVPLCRPYGSGSSPGSSGAGARCK